MRIHFPVDLTGKVNMIEKLVFGETCTKDIPNFSPTHKPMRHQVIFYDAHHMSLIINCRNLQLSSIGIGDGQNVEQNTEYKATTTGNSNAVVVIGEAATCIISLHFHPLIDLNINKYFGFENGFAYVVRQPIDPRVFSVVYLDKNIVV